MAFLKDETARIFEYVAKMPDEPGCEGPVDDPVVIREGQRQHQPRGELAAIPYRFDGRTDHPEDGDLGGVDDRGEPGAADTAEAGDRERAPLQVGDGELAVPRPGRHSAEFLAQLGDA